MAWSRPCSNPRRRRSQVQPGAGSLETPAGGSDAASNSSAVMEEEISKRSDPPDLALIIWAATDESFARDEKTPPYQRQLTDGLLGKLTCSDECKRAVDISAYECPTP